MSYYRCDPLLVNKSGQNTLDIAEFWDHAEVISLLKNDPQTKKSAETNVVNYFGFNPLDRQSQNRNNPDWLASAIKAPTTTFVLYRDLSPYVKPSESSSGSFHYALCPFSYSDVAFALGEKDTSTVLLGVGPVHSELEREAGAGDEGAWFALDVSSIPHEKIQGIQSDAEPLPKRNLAAMMTLKEEEAGIVAQGRSMLAWHDRYRFCPTCGAATTMKDAGYKRICTKEGQILCYIQLCLSQIRESNNHLSRGHTSSPLLI